MFSRTLTRCGQFEVLGSLTSYSQRVRPFGRNPSRAADARTVVVRKTNPTTKARRQPEQVIITGSEGKLVCHPLFASNLFVMLIRMTSVEP